MPESAFHKLPPTPRSHFHLWVGAAVVRLAYFLMTCSGDDEPSEERLFQRYGFMRPYLDDIKQMAALPATWSDSRAWWQRELMTWEEGAPGHLPLRALRSRGISWLSTLALVTAGLTEIDSRFGMLFSELQAPAGQRRPTVELLGRIVTDPFNPEEDRVAICRPLLEAGLLQPLTRELPRLEWELAVPAPLWDAIQGDTTAPNLAWCHFHAHEELPQVEQLILPAETRSQLAAAPGLLRAGEVRTLILRGMKGGERLEAAQAVAGRLGRNVLEIDLPAVTGGGVAAELLGPLSTLTNAMPVVTCDPAPGETAALPVLPGYDGPIAALLGYEGGFVAPGMDRSLTLILPAPTRELRRQYWQQTLPALSGGVLAEATERYHLPGGYIRQVATMARTAATLSGRTDVTTEDIRAAARALGRQALETLAARLDAAGSWKENLVVSGQVLESLEKLRVRCQHREVLLGQLGEGVESRSNRGVRILFQGPSGTGKTLAARLLAAELKMDIYRVDLAAVINKYIGETEKNLHRILSSAEELDVILLLDEGDALLSRRSEVKSANDRYANLETNYLLQRLESYQGIVVVTTNAGDQIDPAFRRRMDVVIAFPPPDAAERLGLLRLHLGPVSKQMETYLAEVAHRCALTGGQIRNAAIHASLLALEQGTPVAERHLKEALLVEYRKAGALCPLADDTPAQPSVAGDLLARFKPPMQ